MERLGPGEFVEGAKNSIDVGEFEVHAHAADAVRIAVTHKATKKTMYAVLYQTVRNLDTNHGLTGLHYINSPVTKGWMNLYCKAMTAR